jgi:hypothetical protein
MPPKNASAAAGTAAARQKGSWAGNTVENNRHLNPKQDLPADPRAVFLLRAAARYELVAASCMDIEEAVGGLHGAVCQLFPCDCEVPA